MVHNLDITAGQASFVSAREDAWHHLGTVTPGALTAEDALKHSNLSGWNMRKVPAECTVGGQTLLIPNQFAVVRDNPVIKGQVDVLGAVGKAYQIIHPEDLTHLLDTLVDESGAHYETAGALDGGRKVFVTMKMPGTAKVGGVDQVDNYIAAMTSNDGSTSTCIMTTPVRVACQNTLNLAFQRADHMFKIRHTVGAHKIIVQQAREALEFTFNYLDSFQEEAEKLINTTLTQARFEELIERNFGAPKDAPAPTVTRTQNKLDHMAELFSDAFTQEGIRGTAWAGLNALTEYADHFSPVRGAGPGNESDARSRKALMDPSFKNSALKMMMELV